ncbi:galactokinase [Maribacter aestuarii]|uniref:galactokinase n=1 Tax=Maribacter aestuarii TaxID=1130723 RepID=UPI0025A65E8A|nr:galactokinase [Maribacter aestuarii]
MIKSQIASYFRKYYSESFKVIKSPGRVNIIGEHTDYNLGFVLPASIEKAIYFAVNLNNSDEINIETFLTSPEKITFKLEGQHNSFDSFWGNYFKAILEILRERNYPLKGFDCVFGGDIPIGSGLSSSAALCCGFIYALSVVLEKEIPRKEIALIAQGAEHKIGLNCGLMDQYAVLFGKKGNALFLDCKDLSYKYVPINLKGYSWVLINSNIKHNLAVDSEYNKRRASCETVATEVSKKKDNVSSLREVTPQDLEDVKNQVAKLDFTRANYVIQENERVLKMIELLNKGEAELVGKVLLEGHWAMSKEFEITTTELDCLVRIGMEIDAVHGSRMMGGGFGGCTINLINTDSVDESVNIILSKYRKETGILAEVYQLQIGDGVHILE